MSIVITNPETGVKHKIDQGAYDELATAYNNALETGNEVIVFRAMRMDITDVDSILAAVDEESLL